MITLCAEILNDEREEFLQTDIGKICCVTSCGRSLDGKGNTLDRAKGWFDTMLVYVIGGKMELSVGDKPPIAVNVGETAIVPDSVPYKMKSFDGNRYYFAHFTTSFSLESFKIPKKLSFFVGESPVFCELFNRIVFSLKSGAENLHFSSVYMLELLCEIGAAYEKETLHRVPKDRFEKVVEIMEDSCRGEAQIKDFAQMCEMNERSFRDEFLKRKGITPKQFLVSCQVGLFKEHIEAFPKTPLNRLSATCGFANYKYAVKLFRREVGVTPQQYRDSVGKEPHKSKFILPNSKIYKKEQEK